jgi:rhamnose utilization protein RhaD (predicted bifunctional aldolase and dehydrogenase)
MADVLESLVGLSHELGREERRLTILGEGNTSAALEDGTFYVKASGHQLKTITRAGFSRVRLDDVMKLLDGIAPTEEALHAALLASLVDGSEAKPSIETVLHAICLREAGAKFVCHTHAEACMMLLCSGLGAEPFLSHIYPDAIVMCGKVPAVVPYASPGLELAIAVRQSLRTYAEVHERSPKLVLLINHGIMALGQTAADALNITLMAEKWARILHGALAVGGARHLSAAEVDSIDQRLDEVYRRERLSREKA